MIPKIIHYAWFGNKSMPASVKRHIKEWSRVCPDYKINIWTEDNFDVNINTYCKQAYEKKAWGFVPDYIRLWIVYKYGGIYLDTDVQLIKSFDSLLSNAAFVGFEKGTEDAEGQFVNLGQGFGAEKGNKFIGANMKIYEELRYVKENGSLNRTPSPFYTTQVLKSQFGLDRKSEKIQYLNGVTVYPSDFFCPKDFGSGLMNITKNTISIHQFDGSWCNEEEISRTKNRWKVAKVDYWKHFPNRMLKNVIGEDKYEILKKKIKNKSLFNKL